MHRLYGSVKLAPHRPTKEENALNLSAFSGRDATAKKIASMTGVSAATVKRAHQFGKVVEALQEVSPQAAERVLRGEVRGAFVANSQTPPLFRGRAGGLERYVMEALRLQSNSLHHRLQSELAKP
jgi:hypothetical protein